MPLTLVEEFAATFPAGTPKAAPLVVPTKFEVNVVERIVWRFPPGALGVVGIQIGAGPVPVIPANPGGFLVASGETTSYDVDQFPVGGDWSVIGYNTGVFPHTVYVTFIVHRVVPQPPLFAALGGMRDILSLGDS